MTNIADYAVIIGVIAFITCLAVYWQHKVVRQLKSKWAKYVYLFFVTIAVAVGFYGLLLVMAYSS